MQHHVEIYDFYAIRMTQARLLKNLSILPNRLECLLSRPPQLGILQEHVYANSSSAVRTSATLMQNQHSFLVTNKHLFVNAKRMAGHNKWSNIKHIKASKDQAKSILHNKFVRLIRMAVKDGGNQTDPKINGKLAHVLIQAKENSVSKSCIESALKGAVVSKDNLAPYTFEIKGPGKCFLVVETLTDNYTKTKQLVKSCLKKTSSVYAEGISKSAFTHKGVIIVEDNGSLSLDKAVDVAIQAGAEDVTQITTDDGENAFQFFSDPGQFWNVRTNLQELNYVIQSSSVQYVPTVKQPLTDDDISIAEKLYDLLERLPEVVNIYDNIE
uniref:Translational activator of cytochrome c oxidase 1 n=1 Tax=Strigamia maritima TaxID=126957 RepID=T1JEQ5_STRMM